MEQLRARLTLSEQDAEQELGMIARLAADLGQPAPEARPRPSPSTSPDLSDIVRRGEVRRERASTATKGA